MTKICAKCKQEKPLDCYYTQNNKSDGKESVCKDCRNKSKKKKPRKSKEKLL